MNKKIGVNKKLLSREKLEQLSVFTKFIVSIKTKLKKTQIFQDHINNF